MYVNKLIKAKQITEHACYRIYIYIQDTMQKITGKHASKHTIYKINTPQKVEKKQNWEIKHFKLIDLS